MTSFSPTESTNSSSGSGCHDSGHRKAKPAADGLPGWCALSRTDRLAIAVTLLVAAVSTLPRLPPGICFDDFGDLQLASETLGIMHPTGYPGYVTLGYLITRVPGVDPAYLVSLACLASGFVALWLCILTQVRLGVSAWVACAWCLVLLAHPRVWMNLVAPEVYAPTLAFSAGAAYCLIRYARLGIRRNLLIAAILFGVAFSNRPPILLALPFFLIGWWFARRPWETSWRRSAVSAALATSCAALPCLYALGYLWVRDTPDAPYNYIEQYNAQWKILPPADAGWKAKSQRIAWHVSGRQFRKFMGNSWHGVRSKLRWLRHELLHQYQVILASIIVLMASGAVVTYRRCRARAWRVGGVIAAGVLLYCAYRAYIQPADVLPPLFAGAVLGGIIVIVAFGVVITYRRCRTAAWLLGGMAVASVVFVCVYRVHGQSADVLPLLFAGTVFGGVAASPLFARQSDRVRSVVAVGCMLTMCAVTLADAPHRRHTGVRNDATSYVSELDMKTLPKDAVICTGWRAWPPLCYAQRVMTKRSDIHIINAEPNHWLAMLDGLEDRPVFVTRKYSALKGQILTPFRNLLRLERPARSAGSTAVGREEDE